MRRTLATAALLLTTAHATAAEPATVTCESLAVQTRWMPWLSEPGSRLVLNPTPGNQAANLTPADAAGLPVHLAFYVGERPLVLRDFWSWNLARRDAKMVPSVSLDVAWRGDGATVAWQGDVARVTLTAARVGLIERDVTADLSQTPWLTLRVADLPAGAQWSAKANDGGGGPDVFLQRDTTRPGSFAYDVAAATGWRGRRTFRVRLFVIAPKEGAAASATFAAPALASGPPVEAIVGSKTTAMPHLVTEHGSATGIEIDSATLFAKPDAVAQSLTVTRGGGTLLLTGDAGANATVRWDAAARQLTVDGDRYRATLHVSRAARLLGTWADRHDYLDRGYAERAQPPSRPAVWSLAFDDVRAGERVVVTSRFATDATPEPLALTAAAFDDAVAARSREWSQRLSRVPQPASFALTAVDARGVAPEQLRRTYYRAWAFLFATVLPPMPENDFPWPQVATGKPSTWDEGHPRASASAQWESMIGVQLLALVEPETAWRAFEGMMSLVDAEGTMDGEGLPSRHAQAAWVLYDVTRDADRLRKSYGALRRMLRWKIDDPRWIYRGMTPPGTKDSEFVAHALLDIGYARQVARALVMPDEDAMWAAQSTQLAARYVDWFWARRGGETNRLFDAPSGTRYDRNGPWALQGLALPPAVLAASERDSLLALMRRVRRDNLPFLVPNLTKHATYLLATRGMLRYGTPDEAVRMAEIAARDVVRAGEFAEFYAQGEAGPTPLGVTPSIFGAAMIVDAWLLRHGLDLGEGRPRAVGVALPGAVPVRMP